MRWKNMNLGQQTLETQSAGLPIYQAAPPRRDPSKPSRVIMIYPEQGVSGAYVRHMPLSLLYASVELVQDGFDVKILDTRLHQKDWHKRLKDLLGDDVLAVGISVMSGQPIKNATKIGRYVKSLSPGTPIVWGGPHATFYPENILEGEWSCDYVVSGYASETFHELCLQIQQGEQPKGISGVCWRHEGEIHENPLLEKAFEYIDYDKIPYHLIEDYSPYGQLEQEHRIFSMYSAVGCPYQCSFCSSPAQYSNIDGKKWVPLEAAQVVDHIQHVHETYGANYIYFIDDDSFPKLSHVEGIIDEIANRGINVKLGFRGARINEIKRMSHEFLDKLAAAGTDIMHIGAESGSDRILKLLRKDSSYDDVIACNRKLAQHPQITAAYNFIMGLPTETLEELKKTRDLMLQLVEDHPNCIIFPPNKFRPLPGTELYDIAKDEWNYEMPDTLEAWANIEVEGDISTQWYDKEFQRFCNLLLTSSYFVDNKVLRVTEGKTIPYKLVRLLNKLYRPLALFRLRNGLSRALFEYTAFRLVSRLLVRDQGVG